MIKNNITNKFSFSKLNFNQYYYYGSSLFLLKNAKKEQIFDFVITSPPYSVQGTENDITKTTDWQLSFLKELLPFLKNGASIIWQIGFNLSCNYGKSMMDVDFLYRIKKEIPELKINNRFILEYEKNNEMGCSKISKSIHNSNVNGRYQTAIWLSKGNPKYINDSISNFSDIIKIQSHNNKVHPYQLPVSFYEHFLKLFTEKNDIVMEPFAGSFSSVDACLNLKRKIVCCETDKQHILHHLNELHRTLSNKKYINIKSSF